MRSGEQRKKSGRGEEGDSGKLSPSLPNPLTVYLLFTFFTLCPPCEHLELLKNSPSLKSNSEKKVNTKNGKSTFRNTKQKLSKFLEQ